MANRTDKWDRERFHWETGGGTRFDERSRYDDDDDARSYTRRASPPLRFREDERRRSALDDEFARRDRRYYEDGPRSARRPPSPRREEYEHRVRMETGPRSPSPRRPQRPSTLLRRQSSLDTFDRRPRGFHDRVEEYGPPARREDYRAAPYVPIPLPRTRALPPPRRYEQMDEIRISDPDHYGDDAFHTYPGRATREREVIRERRRDRSHSRTRSHRSSTVRSSSRSSSTSSSSSSRTATTVKSEYPKKGKTRIPAKLVSKRAIIELGYPFEEEGNTIIIQRALGQENIDDLLRLSEDYKKCEVEVLAARSEAGEVIEERRREEVWVTAPPPAPVVVPTPVVVSVPPPAPSVAFREEQPVIIEEPRRGVRIEKDKKGRMSISVPKYR
ncbi:hypothetical protein, variant [Magnaporthiopsis poae ATCC 64411]|uniref:DUF8035 domain-containing protein n=1 Tax=Magnaporthiopsis poae (strain ATCC 64411 / 73-15) TaxID=644358 RepID=A0A0C4DM19_MAGP6|nr:hypothetical protein, variant [Magnaporthiopsis poae ATCC 64411]